MHYGQLKRCQRQPQLSPLLSKGRKPDPPPPAEGCPAPERRKMRRKEAGHTSACPLIAPEGRRPRAAGRGSLNPERRPSRRRGEKGELRPLSRRPRAVTSAQRPHTSGQRCQAAAAHAHARLSPERSRPPRPGTLVSDSRSDLSPTRCAALRCSIGPHLGKAPPRSSGTSTEPAPGLCFVL